MTHLDAIYFIAESKRIEGILSPPTEAEITEHNRFMNLTLIAVSDLEQFVAVFEPAASLRRHTGMNVQVGNHIAPPGGPEIETALSEILIRANSGHYLPSRIHLLYEKLHPFSDCNGRSGRMLWLWMMREAPLGFLHTWYYQSLEHGK